ncbi:MAG: Ltp family lipoprotein, partial [Clostridia bacterium]|nr:Ltp family lipoprotein [Clostridia bacterium]
MSKKVTVKVDRTPKQEPVELNTELFDEDALNEEFEATYKDKKRKEPFYKRWWFWLLLAALLLGIAAGIFAFRDNSLESVEATTVTTEAGQTAQIVSETTTAAPMTVKDFVMPAGASVRKLNQGWGLYDANRNLVSSYNGIAANDMGTWYIKNGLVDFSYTGDLSVNGAVYHVEKGKVQISSPSSAVTTAAASTQAATQSSAAVTTETTPSAVATATGERQKALVSAQNKLGQMAYSRQWLIAELQNDGFTGEDATWGVDHCNVDWNDQAYRKAKEYLTLT